MRQIKIYFWAPMLDTKTDSFAYSTASAHIAGGAVGHVALAMFDDDVCTHYLSLWPNKDPIALEKFEAQKFIKPIIRLEFPMRFQANYETDKLKENKHADLVLCREIKSSDDYTIISNEVEKILAEVDNSIWSITNNCAHGVAKALQSMHDLYDSFSFGYLTPQKVVDRLRATKQWDVEKNYLRFGPTTSQTE